MVNVEELQPAGFPEYDSYVDAHPAATFFQLRAWKTVAEYMGHRAPFLVAREGPAGAIRGVLPIMVTSRFFRRWLSTGVFGAHGGVLADDTATAQQLLAAARELTATENASHLQVRAFEDPLLDKELQRRDGGLMMARLELDSDPAKVWSRVEGKIRRFVKTGRKHNLTVQTGRQELEAFTEIYADVLHRHGSLTQGAGFLRTLVDALGDRAEVMVVYSEGKPIGASLVCNFNGIVFDIFGGSRREAFEMRPNHFMNWEVIERACARKMKIFELGISFTGSTLHEYQSGWNCKFLPFPDYFHIRRRRMPGPPIGRIVTGKAVGLLPRSLADKIAPSASRWFGNF